MKILELTRSFYPSIGGMEKFVADRLKIYEHLGYDYQVITTTYSEKQLYGSRRLDNVIYLPIYTPYGIVPAIPKALRTDYDILSVNQLNYYYSWQAISKAKKDKKKIILTPHFYFHTNKFKLIKNIHNRFVLPKILKAVDRIICFTEFEASFWNSAFPIVKHKITVIPHYFNPPTIKAKNTENKYGNFLLFIGRGEVNKRIDLLIKAFNKTTSNYQLVLTIDSDEVPHTLKDIVKKDERIHLLGRIPEDEKQNLLSICSALILPSDYEAFGIVNLEASWYRKPLLVTRLKVFEETLDNKGVLFFENNMQSIKERIEYFLRLDTNVKRVMGETNFKNLERYSFEVINNNYHHLINDLTSLV